MATKQNQPEVEARHMARIENIYLSALKHQLPINVIRQRLATDVYGTLTFSRLTQIRQYGLRMYDKGMMRIFQQSNTRPAYNLIDEIAFIGSMDEIQQATLARYSTQEARRAFGYYYPDTHKPFETEQHKA